MSNANVSVSARREIAYPPTTMLIIQRLKTLVMIATLSPVKATQFRNMDDDDSIDIEPRSPRELLGRAALLAALGRRGLIEAEADDDPMSAETDQFDLQAWTRVELGFWMSPHDLHILQAPVGSLIEQEEAYCADALVSASTIGWCMGVSSRPLPLLSDGAPEREVLAWTPAPWTTIGSRVRLVRVRTDDELARERERWELIVWRLSLFTITASLPDDEAALRDVLVEVANAGIIPVSGDDFATDEGQPFRDLEPNRRDQLDAEATLRLQAMNWVCGFGDRWEDVPLFPD